MSEPHGDEAGLPPVTGNSDVDAVLLVLAQELDGSAGERLTALSRAQDDLARILEHSRQTEHFPEPPANAS